MILKSQKPREIAEYEARGEIARVFHEIKQVMRVTGVNLNFRTWASFDKFFPVMWDAMRPNAEARVFEEASDEIRAEAVDAAATFGRLEARTGLSLGESRSFHIRAALDLYHYINPKLLLFTSAVRLALKEEFQVTGKQDSEFERVQRGAPEKMAAMEMVSDSPSDKDVEKIFEDMKKSLSLTTINSDYRTLALWPDYLSEAWKRLKPITQSDGYGERSDQIRQKARSLCSALPYPADVSMEKVKNLGEDPDQVLSTTERFERLLPSLIINIALFQLDWRPPEALRQSPFPAQYFRAGGRT